VFFVIDRFAGRRSGIADKVGYVAVAAAVLALTLAAERKTEAHFHIAETRLPLSIRAARAAYAVSYYALKPWIPTQLSRAYPATLVPRSRQGMPPKSFWSLRIAGGVAATVLLCIFGCWFRRTLGPFVLCHVLLLAPMLGITLNGDYVTFDRYCALACGAWAVGIALVILRVRKDWRPSIAMIFCAYLLVLAGMSERQTYVWRNWESVVANVASHVRRNQFPDLQYYSPAYEFMMSGKYDQAVEVVVRGLGALPNDPNLLSLAKQIAGCRVSYTRFCPFAEAHVALGGWFLKTHDWREADEHLGLALELSPGDGEAAYNRALVRLDLGRYRDALHDFLWADAHMPAPFSPQQREAVLNRVAEEAGAANDLPLVRALAARTERVSGRGAPAP
jgi:tetratricopeptide (TPR) repeat protein